MDKQQATDFIITRLRAGYQTEEITEELSRLVKAPSEKVRPFVNQVTANHPGAMPPNQADLIGNFSEEPVAAEISNADEHPTPQPDNRGAGGFSDLPPGLQALVREAESAGMGAPRMGAPRMGAPRMGVAKPATIANPEISHEIPLPRQAEFVAPSKKEEENDIDLEALEEFALGQLKKQRRHNDIVEAVCHKTGWHWNKSQRFVARVQTKHHDELQSGRNRITIIVGIGIIIGGLIVAINGIGALSDYAKIAVFAKTNPEVLLSISPSAVFFALTATVTGLGMVVGGGYGVARSLTNR